MQELYVYEVLLVILMKTRVENPCCEYVEL